MGDTEDKLNLTLCVLEYINIGHWIVWCIFIFIKGKHNSYFKIFHNLGTGKEYYSCLKEIQVELIKILGKGFEIFSIR